MVSVLCPLNSEEAPVAVPAFSPLNGDEVPVVAPEFCPPNIEEDPAVFPVFSPLNGEGAPAVVTFFCVLNSEELEPKLALDGSNSEEPKSFPVFDVPNIEELLVPIPELDKPDGCLVAKRPLSEAFCLLASGSDGAATAARLNNPNPMGVGSFPCEVLPSNGIVVWFLLVDRVDHVDVVGDGFGAPGSGDGGIRLADVSALFFPGRID